MKTVSDWMEKHYGSSYKYDLALDSALAVGDVYIRNRMASTNETLSDEINTNWEQAEQALAAFETYLE